GPGEFIDDVVIHVFRAPRSYTGEDLIEITSHGSPVIARQILGALVACGARQAEPGEFSRRAFFNGKIAIEDAELISIKADAHSEAELRGAELAMREKYHRLKKAYDALIALIARVDAEIDFGESDDIEIEDFDERVHEATQSLEALMRESTNRRLNTGFFSVAFTGPPNVGKSSVFNALLNFERSIVSEVPGTTRDYVEAFIEVEGFRVKLIDTAGIRETGESIEARGITLGANAATRADISLRVTDPTDRAPRTQSGNVLLHNKKDLDGWQDALSVSARTGEGMPDLHAWLARELQKKSPELSQIRLSETEMTRLEHVRSRLEEVNAGMEPALLAEDLRNAASELAMLLGENISANSLDYIFSKMCIGK